MKKIIINSLVITLITVLFFSICMFAFDEKHASGEIDTPMGFTVVIDAGHGGEDTQKRL